MPNSKQDNQLFNYIKTNPLSSSSAILRGSGIQASYATVKRMLKQLVEKGQLEVIGRGKGSKYQLSKTYKLIYPIDVGEYFQKEIDEREINKQFNHNLIRDLLIQVDLFNQQETNHLNKLQEHYGNKISKLSEREYKMDVERLAIDLSWKSSQIEGNTYSLLETEQLLKEKQTAAGKTKDEAVMLLNHKTAIDFLFQHQDYLVPLSISGIEDIHSMLVQDLPNDRNIRTRTIGITGTNYSPLDNSYQIREALDDMCKAINEQQNVFSKALLVLLLISYIQPFVDGNKRTARIVCNGILMNFNFCPMSFRTVDALDYKKAMLIFYEQNNLSAFKKIFITQFEFAVMNYF